MKKSRFRTSPNPTKFRGSAERVWRARSPRLLGRFQKVWAFLLRTRRELSIALCFGSIWGDSMVGWSRWKLTKFPENCLGFSIRKSIWTLVTHFRRGGNAIFGVFSKFAMGMKKLQDRISKVGLAFEKSRFPSKISIFSSFFNIFKNFQNFQRLYFLKKFPQFDPKHSAIDSSRRVRI